MDLDSALYDAVCLQEDYYYFYIFSVCRVFESKVEAKAFDSEKISKLVRAYLIKLHEAKLLKSSLYPHTNVPRYRRTESFFKVSSPPKMNIQDEFNTSFSLDLEMQQALCNFEIFECYSELEIYNSKNNKIGLDGGKDLIGQKLKDRLVFFQEKVSIITRLLEMTSVDKL